MSEKEVKDLEHDLLGSLLQHIDMVDEDQKRNGTLERMQAFSAPPVFSEVNYKLDFDLLETSTFESPDPEDQTIMEAFLKREAHAKSSFDLEHMPMQNYRKMSCDSALIDYRESPHSSSFSYYDYIPVYSPAEQLLSNLENVSDWARDQNGSRTVQDIFETADDEKKDLIFSVIFKDSMELMMDRFGNYVFQKILEKGLDSHKQVILNSLWGSIFSFSTHAYGCRVIQKVMENLRGKVDKQQKFMQEILPNVLTLIQNQNGNHVIQKCFELFPHQRVKQIVSILMSKLNVLAYHIFGCRVVQKYLQSYEDQPECKQILSILLEQSLGLSQCQFGNYVMQHIVTKCKQERKQVFTIFLANILSLSTNKYASNVIQKAIQAKDSHFSEDLGQYFEQNTKDLVYLSKHQFGNYVIQSMINRLPKEQKLPLKASLKQNASEISKSQHGRHVLLQIEHSKSR